MAQTNGVNGHTNGVNGHTNGVNGHTNGANGTHLPALSTSAEEFLKHDYDFIIVGGGTAGLTVAARLTENEDVTVGVLEAGKNRLGDPLVDTPAAFFAMFNNPEYDWAFMTEPQVRRDKVRFRRGCANVRFARNTTMARGTISLEERRWVAVAQSTTHVNRSQGSEF